MTIRNLEEANQALLPYVPLVSQLTGKDTTLARIVPLMERLGNPQNRLRVIHIAGTSGKTSTAYFMAALLRAGGKNVGLTVSPHIDSVTERVQLDGQPISEAEFCELLGEFLELIKDIAQPPSYFELLYAFSLWVFDRQEVDYAVVETGMGGLHDATNVATRPDKICIITDIGFDHTHILGKTLPKITEQKIGIVHADNQVFMYRQADEIMQVAEEWTDNHHGQLHIVDEPPANNADYQQRNWQLAYSAYNYMEKRDDLEYLTSQVLQKTQRLQIPARMDIKQLAGKTIVMDGAHNLQKMTVFARSFHDKYPNTKPVVLLALKEGKEYQGLLPVLAKLSSHYIVTTFDTSQDLPVRSMDPEVLGQALTTAGIANVTILPDQKQALQSLLQAPEDIAIITGSFYLLSQMRNNENLS